MGRRAWWWVGGLGAVGLVLTLPVFWMRRSAPTTPLETLGYFLASLANPVGGFLLGSAGVLAAVLVARQLGVLTLHRTRRPALLWWALALFVAGLLLQVPVGSLAATSGADLAVPVWTVLGAVQGLASSFLGVWLAAWTSGTSAPDTDAPSQVGAAVPPRQRF